MGQLLLLDFFFLLIVTFTSRFSGAEINASEFYIEHFCALFSICENIKTLCVLSVFASDNEEDKSRSFLNICFSFTCQVNSVCVSVWC